ncbi:hypothetical protein OW763_00360 [Clostridium aestuarii]|uniref:Polymerase/histidinol phosphatase N-terminal domain-containing protein n=1 Tax=Clostridium aestuarii TaxID=338193 RepID=A0ABT4CXJ4_9CLOT|nr:hypothetical protein [Clostridium aestuarii]MCY6482810.1 hypothetical protein [Clostridium aestuarii]
MDRGSEWRKWDLHVHTAASYDYKYKSSDCDEFLVNSWKKQELVAVAITDHFVIDVERIKKLKQMVPNIKIFPGVELRCDKGTSNLHVIIIFPDKEVDNLANRFNVIMKDAKAKNKDNNDTIYWDYSDIIEFAKKNQGIISVHAGKKDKGIDDGITNSLEVNMAIKEEIAEHAHIFEMGRLKDIDDYNKYVFKEIERKPMIICSDNHDPRDYIIKENLWVKADLTFEGLQQAIKEPQLRFFVGNRPPKKKIIEENSNKFIDSIKIQGITSEDKWFGDEILLNYDLVTIIGNKGNGKSALADIIGHAGNTHNNRFSFLSENRFNQKTDYLGKNYSVKLKWKNGTEEEKNLFPIENNMLLEKVKYLPQKYIEDVCNDLKDEFKDEIERLIFDYLPDEEKMGKKSLDELMQYLTDSIIIDIDSSKIKLKELNAEILAKEKQISDKEKQILYTKLKEYEKELEQENRNKPKDISKPSIDNKVEKKLNLLNSQIEDYKKKLEIRKKDLENITKKQYVIENTIQQIEKTKGKFCEWIEKINDNLKNNGINELIIGELKINYQKLILLKEFIKSEILNIKADISVIEEDGKDGIIVEKLKRAQKEVKEITNTLTKSEIIYQKYVEKTIKWREKLTKISDKITQLRENIRVLEKDLPKELDELYKDRKRLCMVIYKLNKEIIDKYAQKYSYIKKAISELNMKNSEKPNIEINLYLDVDSMEDKILNYINQNVKSIFRGKQQAKENLVELVEELNVEDFNSIFDCVSKIESKLKKSVSDYDKVFKDKIEFFNNLYGLDYIKINYELKLGDKVLSKLSPGERGLLLLIFYLILDKENTPLIIDQPEDNLDNQSIFKKLVKYIIKAKEKRQIIIVTHNPNIAVACDSEQIIYSKMDKEKLQIRYKTGSMESLQMNEYIVDVLEGTMPAFEKRSNKYKR